MSVQRTNVQVGSRTLSVSNLDKILFPRDGYAKGDLIDYYRSVAQWILPHLRDRPLTLQRYPDGIDAESFFGKGIPKGIPDWIPRESLESPEGRRSHTNYLICNDEPTLVYVANLASIVLHLWTSRIDSIEEPDYVFFDLDPGERCSLRTLAQVALELRAMLRAVDLDVLVKTSGGMGLHVVLPLASGYSYETAKLFAEIVAQHLLNAHPELVTLQRSVAKRDETLVYLDYLQVGRGKTIVSAYSVRARDGAPVSTPLDWSEVEFFARTRTGAPSEAFAEHTIRTTLQRLERDGDLWSGKAWKKQKLESAIKKAQKAWS